MRSLMFIFTHYPTKIQVVCFLTLTYYRYISHISADGHIIARFNGQIIPTAPRFRPILLQKAVSCILFFIFSSVIIICHFIFLSYTCFHSLIRANSYFSTYFFTVFVINLFYVHHLYIYHSTLCSNTFLAF